MEGDLLQVELGGDIKRIQLSADGSTATSVETVFNVNSQPLGIVTIGDDGPFPGLVLTANRGSGDVTVFDPVDDGSDGGDGDDSEPCTGAADVELTVTDDEGATETTQTVTVSDAPAAERHAITVVGSGEWRTYSFTVSDRVVSARVSPARTVSPERPRAVVSSPERTPTRSRGPHRPLRGR